MLSWSIRSFQLYFALHKQRFIRGEWLHSIDYSARYLSYESSLNCSQLEEQKFSKHGRFSFKAIDEYRIA